MPKASKKEETPPELRPYIFHGLDLEWSKSKKNAQGDCPFCGAEDRFGVQTETSKWQCWSCDSGNKHTFIRRILEESKSHTTDKDYEQLKKERGFHSVKIMKEFGFVKSYLNGDWLIPAGRNKNNEVMSAYRYVGGNVLPTPTMGVQMFGDLERLPDCSTVYLCEGPWDTYALHEGMSTCQISGDGSGLFGTASDTTFLEQEDACVVGIPGVLNFSQKWAPQFANKNVVMMMDNDHPKIRCKDCRKSRSIFLKEKSCPHCKSVEIYGSEVEPASVRGIKKSAGVLQSCSTPPNELFFLRWGEKGFNPEWRSGTDVRDYLKGDINAEG